MKFIELPNYSNNRNIILNTECISEIQEHDNREHCWVIKTNGECLTTSFSYAKMKSLLEVV